MILLLIALILSLLIAFIYYCYSTITTQGKLLGNGRDSYNSDPGGIYRAAALGVPVVTIPFSGFNESNNPVPGGIFIAHNKKQFEVAIREILKAKGFVR